MTWPTRSATSTKTKPWHTIRTLIAVLTVGMLTFVTAACDGGGFGGNANSLKVLAGSEVKDLEPILNDMAKETGVSFDITYAGTLEGTEKLVNEGQGDFDLTWFPSNYYLSLFEQSKSLVGEEKSIMSSPVVLGLKPEKAKQLGWSEDKQPAWADVAQAAEKGDLKFGMTSPLSSNSGFSTVLEAATALSGSGNALQTKDVEAATEGLSKFSKGTSLTSGSSGWLAEAFAKDQSKADGIFNYESVLKGMDFGGQPPVLIAPSDGVVTADYPLTLLDGADDTTKEKFNKVTEYLLSDEVQQRITDETHRRTKVSNPDEFPTTFETPYPATLDTVQKLLEAWVANGRKPATMFFQIDTSGSMRGERLEQLKTALGILSGTSAKNDTERFLAIQPREKLKLVEFSHEVKSTDGYRLTDNGSADKVRRDLDTKIQTLTAEGGTAIYSTLQTTLESAKKEKSDDKITSVVVFTDGMNEHGISFRAFKDWYSNNQDVQDIPVFAVSFGNADSDELQELVSLTGGRVFDGNADLTAAFKDIRGYL